ncbi:MAG: alanine--tRNA ligase, partial [Deltaproteobacteria bacterium]|nr:alanine--tRNA ligase [Deltaproteobacteria bacterium]
QREKARESWKGSGEAEVSAVYRKLSLDGVATEFVGYEGVTEVESKILAILKEDRSVKTLAEGEKGEIFVEQTPFYGEVGGQVGDVGVIEADGAAFDVSDTQKPLDTLFSHIGKMTKGKIALGDRVILRTNEAIRRAIEANHSGTHLLQAALKAVLGDHVKQSGSLVNAERLRFDFTHFAKVDEAELQRVEELANRFIRMNRPVTTEVLPREKAMTTGATAVFDEKYGDEVRVVKMGDVSMELCGGTHVRRTGDLGFLKILGESSVAAGVRRIEAVTGGEAVRHVDKVERELKDSASLMRANLFEVKDRIVRMLNRQKELEKEIDALKGKLAAKDSLDILSGVKEVAGVRILAALVEASDVKALRDFGDKVRDKLQSGVVLLGSKIDGKAMLLCMVTKDLLGRYHAGEIVKIIAPIVGGSGGGRPDMAQAGGSDQSRLAEALVKFEEVLLRGKD